jgi:predicted nucleic acid-binding protein
MNKNCYFLDTSFIIALINEKDQYHQTASKLADDYDNSFLVTSEPILLEIGNGLSKNYKQEATDIIEYLLNSNNVEVVSLTPELFKKGFDLYKKFQDKKWGLVDCISFVIMSQKNITYALSFDNHFNQAGFSIVEINK